MGRRLRGTTWATGQKWHGFRGAAYCLDSEKVWNFPIEARASNPQQKLPATIGDVLAQLQKSKLGDVDSGISRLTVSIDGNEQTYTGISFNLTLLETCLLLHKEGARPFDARFFFYDSDAVTDDPHERYNFFVVWDNKIVMEQVSFSDYTGSEFDPSIFQATDTGERMWFSDNAWEQAWIRLWYRRFYTETQTGQLMVLRPDQPELYFYPELRPPVAGHPPLRTLIHLPGINTPFFPRVYRNKHGMTYHEWLESKDPGLGDWSPENPDPSLTVNSRFLALLAALGSVFQWLFVLGGAYIAVSVIQWMWNHPLF